MGKKINNYTEYKKRLEEFFHGIDEIPSDEKILSFIDKYDLYIDWEILICEVKKDISTLLLKNKTSKRKSISSYKQYLEQLKKAFGIPEEMPSRKQIKEFIEEYNLRKIWGIIEEDVEQDLTEIIAGNYYDMLNDSESKHNITQKNAVTKPSVNSHTSSVNKNTQKAVFQKNALSNTDYEDSHIHTTSSLSSKPVNLPKETQRDGTKKSNYKKKNNETQRPCTIFIDGDNNINKAQKGIKHIPKNTEVRAIFSQKGAQRKFDKKYANIPNVLSKLVLPGDQAVDNQIKTDAGQLLKKGNQVVIFVSHDKGFARFAKRKNNMDSGNRVFTATSVKDALKKNKYANVL